MTHPDHVVGYKGSLKDLAKAVGNMDYHSGAEFLRHLSEDFSEQAKKDKENNKPKLAGKLEETASQTMLASLELSQAARICDPYMQDPKK